MDSKRYKDKFGYEKIKEERRRNIFEDDYLDSDEFAKFFNSFFDDEFHEKEASKPQKENSQSTPPYFLAMGLTLQATKEEILKRYRELAKKAHPDGGGSHEAFLQLKENKELCLKHLK